MDDEEIHEWIKKALSQTDREAFEVFGLKFTEAQYRFFTDNGRFLSPVEQEYAQRRAARAWHKDFIQTIELAAAIDNGDISEYIARWHPQTPPSNGSRIEWRTISIDEVELTRFGVIEEIGQDAFVRDPARLLVSKIAGEGGSATYSSAMGEAKDNSLDGTHQTSEATAIPVCTRLLRHGLLALGCIHRLLNKARGH